MKRRRSSLCSSTRYSICAVRQISNRRDTWPSRSFDGLRPFRSLPAEVSPVHRNLCASVCAVFVGACSNSSGPGNTTTGAWALVAAGSAHTCALTPGGSAYCWGDDIGGELGDGAAHDGGFSTKPVAVAGGLHFSSIAAGGGITCGLTTSGKAYCWGYNTNGALGNGDTTVTAVDVPTPVVGGLSFRTISVETVHTCALTTSGEAYCWGENYNGALGTSGVPTYNSAIPLKATGSTAFGSISAGYQQSSCALDSGGNAYCWGHN